ncbi:ClpXP protease specificity-enhancing factor [Gallaecimonas pentaromativorans]|uniref:Stringent starvation protein B n=1 Tax=Gallaecimonas pentaromativorans TaxID=584787 RepID=A0A3N1PPV9_9GAMM|nr:ClpXP protease specificity-enhancing factor [Gallaecimonas pentaromativorans]MED5523595.1 ClpXP protease specificity-enhancing factor [Pseudomonadota bacterium]ROQ30785.1 stringent starvation protein B [Gallaecimonas pentaromativorans]
MAPERLLTPHRPHLLRAFYEWLLENDLTPHLVVDATQDGVEVPQEHVRDGQIVLNIGPSAVGNLNLGKDDVVFSARFGGVPRRIVAPMAALVAIYARENGAGTVFEDEPYYEALREGKIALEESGPEDDPEPPKPGRKAPFLKVVK